jgi:excisionase family DNA binding protein
MVEIVPITEMRNRAQQHTGGGPLAGRVTCTIQEAEAVSGLRRRYIRSLLANGTITSVKIGGRRLIVVRPFLRLLGVEP